MVNEWFGKSLNKMNISPNVIVLDIAQDMKKYLEKYHKL